MTSRGRCPSGCVRIASLRYVLLSAGSSGATAYGTPKRFAAAARASSPSVGSVASGTEEEDDSCRASSCGAALGTDGCLHSPAPSSSAPTPPGRVWRHIRCRTDSSHPPNSQKSTSSGRPSPGNGPPSSLNAISLLLTSLKHQVVMGGARVLTGQVPPLRPPAPSSAADLLADLAAHHHRVLRLLARTRRFLPHYQQHSAAARSRRVAHA